jgi:hypothetical protein
MAGLVPAIPDAERRAASLYRDHRHKAGDDDGTGPGALKPPAIFANAALQILVLLKSFHPLSHRHETC